MRWWGTLAEVTIVAAACRGGGVSLPVDGSPADAAGPERPTDSAVPGSSTAATLPPPATPELVGHLVIPPGLNGIDRRTVAETAAPVDVDAEVVGGALIVGLRPGAALPEVPGYRMQHGNDIGPHLFTVHVTDAAGRALNVTQTREAARRLTGMPGVRLVDLERVRHRRRVPDDPLFVRTWAPRHANLAGAWDIESGSADVVVAVLDDGVKAHPDLAGKLLPGWDMIANPDTAMDGDGRDPDPSPVPHTEKSGRSAWHGEHVAGIVAAMADNRTGLAGAAPGCRILPVRVLGKEGGSVSSDTIAGLYWAAGLEVSGVPVNPHPAQVINLSLGGTGTSSAEQQAVDDVVARGIPIVAAAGNDAREVKGTSWGSYRGVITVGAVDRQGRRAYYSNHGPEVTIMAPGGDMQADLDGDGELDGILSTWFDDAGTTPAYMLQQGTSMAAPLVSGIVALLRSAAPELSPAEIVRLLRSTAIPAPGCSDGCGAGLVDAAAAVLRAKGLEDYAQAAALEPAFERLHLDEGGGAAAFYNAGGGELAWTISFEGPGAGVLAATPRSGVVPAKSGTTVDITVAGAPADRVRHAVLRIASSGGDRSIPVTLASSPAQPDVGPLWVYLYDGSADGLQAGRTPVFAQTSYSFVLRAGPGTWYLGAALDRDADGVLAPGDWWALYPGVSARQTVQIEATPGIIGPYELVLEPFR